MYQTGILSTKCSQLLSRQAVRIRANLEQYKQLREAMEELDDIRAFDEAKASKDEAIPLDQAIREIEQDRR